LTTDPLSTTPSSPPTGTKSPKRKHKAREDSPGKALVRSRENSPAKRRNGDTKLKNTEAEPGDKSELKGI